MSDKLLSACIIAVVSGLVAMYAIPVVASTENSEWTVLIYLDGDNNLDPDSVNDVVEMMAVGSTDKVNVIVLWDRYSEPAYLYKILPGGKELLDGMTVNGAPVNGQEINMGDWHVLEAFVDYGKANYPGDHFMLDLWDHGNAFGYACWDDHDGDSLPAPAAISLREVGQALQGSGAMDILTYDGCTIGMAEIAYELTFITAEMDVQIEYLVASEEYIPNNGYAYDNLLQRMNDMEDTSAAAVAKMLVDEYAATYSPKGDAKGTSTVNLSRIDLSKIGPIAAALKTLTDELRVGLAQDFKYYHGLISDARGEANLGWSLNGWDRRVDLGTFLETLSTISKDRDVKTLATQAFGIIKDAVYVGNTPAMDSQSAYGLGVWFPSSYRSIGNANVGGFWVIDMYASAFEFADDAGWLSFLYDYWGRSPNA
jgi:hypothetical protein